MNLEETTIKLPVIEFNNARWKDALPGNVSRRRVAKILGVSDSNLISIEKGDSLPSILLAFKYCVMNNVPIQELMTVKE